MQRILAIALGAALGATTSVDAVTLNPRGIGQVLIYPYYAVNGGNGTLVSVVNTTDQGKALKVRFHEGYNGRDAANFNVYLSPFDVWVAQVFDTSADGTGAAAIASNDNSCTVPAFSSVFGTPGQGPKGLLFSNTAYSGANSDGGPTGLSRTHEGYIEIIEMGEVTNATQHTLDAISHYSSGIPANCEQLVGAWATGGYWTTNSGTDLDSPTGGLYGAESIIDIAEGTMYTVNAEAIDGFSSAIQHTAPGNAGPGLNTASKSASGIVSAFVPVGGSMVEADYQNSEDAISALFMADNLYNEYMVDPAVGGQSDWLVTFPTKRFYVDPPLLPAGQAPNAKPPFDVLFSSVDGGTSCSSTAWQISNREERMSRSTDSCGILCPGAPDYALCYAANIITFGTATSALGSHLVVANPPYPSGFDTLALGFTAGQFRLDLTHSSHGTVDSNHALTSTNGIVLNGLPALGFLAVNYINANVTPGVLANYSGAYPHRATISCTNSTDPQSSCP